MEQLENLESIRAPFPAILTNKFAAMLDNTNLNRIDRQQPVIQMADASAFAADRGTGVHPIGIAERFCLTAVEA